MYVSRYLLETCLFVLDLFLLEIYPSHYLFIFGDICDQKRIFDFLLPQNIFLFF